MDSTAIHRLASLPARYVRAKREFYASWQEQHFRGYRSPWVPVCGTNQSLLQAGDLIVDRHGIQGSYLEGRRIDKVVGGRVVGTENLSDATPPVLVWVDSRKEERLSRYLSHNPLAQAYQDYSQAFGQVLIKATQDHVALIEPVCFPLYHGTNHEGAQSILNNGIDHLAVQLRRFSVFGCSFHLSVDQGSARRRGNFSGALVEFAAAPDCVPYWINLSDQNVYHAFEALSIFLEGATNRQAGEALKIGDADGLYLWSIVCAELSISALRYGEDLVMVFDSFPEFRPARIL